MASDLHSVREISQQVSETFKTTREEQLLMKCVADQDDPFAVINVHSATRLSDQKLEVVYFNAAFKDMIGFGAQSTGVAFSKRIYEQQDATETKSNAA